MAIDSSATTRETPHINRKSRTNSIVDVLKERAQAVLNDTSIDPQSRAIIHHALETHDPWLARLVRQADAGEDVVQTIESESSQSSGGDDSGRERIELLAEIICRSGEEAAAALFVLMGALQNSTEPKRLRTSRSIWLLLAVVSLTSMAWLTHSWLCSSANCSRKRNFTQGRKEGRRIRSGALHDPWLKLPRRRALVQFERRRVEGAVECTVGAALRGRPAWNRSLCQRVINSREL